MTPELRHLRYFVAVAEELHFSRAAARLNIAQPPLSQQIAQLEEALGLELLVRSTRRVELTAAGHAFLAGARRTLAEAERAMALARRAERAEAETLRLGFSEAAMMGVLPDAIARFRAKLADVQLDLREYEGMRPLAEALHAGVIDLAVARGPLVDETLEVATIVEEPFVVALPRKHPLARRSRISIKALRDVPLILFPRRASPAFYDAHIAAFHASGFAPVVAYELEKFTTILGVIAAGAGVALMPSGNQNVVRPGVVYRPLSGSAITATVVAAWHPDRRPAAAIEFLAAMRVAGRRKAAV